LTVGSITVVGSPSVPEGVVIATDPVTNARLPLGSVVNLILSDGTVEVPDVRNLEVLEARSILTDPSVGFSVAVEILDAELCTGTPGNVVLQQSILPGTSDQRQSITLYVECIGGEEPAPEPDPNSPDPSAEPSPSN
ncbi:MAG: hypothetical protein VW500_03245, partial [Aquiluna sp.]